MSYWTEEEYWIDDKLHRLDGPAKSIHTSFSTTEEYWVDGKLDRIDGPAKIILHSDGTVREEQCWLDDVLQI